jgi:hypothetical protein
VQTEVYEEIAATAAQVMGAMCPRDIAKLVYSLGRVQVGDHAFAAAIKPHIMCHLEHFSYNVRPLVRHSACAPPPLRAPSALLCVPSLHSARLV